jgi:hypothetical protein
MPEPQEVEVYRGQDWVAGSMLGWRRESDRSCRVMVRLTEGRVEKTAWADLEQVRLRVSPSASGRHRAPSEAGRHRAPSEDGREMWAGPDDTRTRPLLVQAAARSV